MDNYIMNIEKADLISKINEIYFRLITVTFIGFIGGFYTLMDAIEKYEGATITVSTIFGVIMILTYISYAVHSILTINILKK